jgi:hypothetical protein
MVPALAPGEPLNFVKDECRDWSCEHHEEMENVPSGKVTFWEERSFPGSSVILSISSSTGAHEACFALGHIQPV